MKKLPIPEAVFDQHIIGLGKTRSGKSSMMRLLVEHLLDEGKPACIVDPKGDWWGIKASADGKSAGYPLVIFGGEHGDVPLNARSGAAVAELVATGNRSALIDLGGWMPGERTQFWIDFASTYFRAHKGRHWLVIDEVHNFCPKGKIMDPNAGKMLHWSNRLASEGLGKGIALLAASQRPQKVHNDFLTSCETLIAMRVIHKADRDALKDWVDACGEPEKGKEVLNTVAQNKRGEAWVYSPESNFGPEKIQFPMFATYDSFKPQRAGETTKLKGWAEVNLADVTKKLEAVVKEAEANDPAKLKARIRELEKQRGTGKTVEVKVADEKAIGRAVRTATAEMEEALRKRDQLAARIKSKCADLAKQLAAIAEIPLPTITIARIPSEPAAHVPAKVREVVPSRPREIPGDDDGRKLKAGAMKMLEVLAQWHPDPRTRDQLGALAGFAPTGGTFSEYLSALRTRGFIVENGAGVEITEEGLAAMPCFPVRPDSPDELIRLWKSKFKAGVGRMLDVLVAAYPEKITREELGEQSGFAAAGGTFSEYLSALRRARLIDETGGRVGAATSVMEV